MKKMMKMVLCAVLAMLLVLAPMEAFAATSVKIYRVNTDQLRVHSTPEQGTANVKTKFSVGTRVFYLGKGSGRASGWWKVRSEYGVTGYVYKDYLSYSTTAPLSRIYRATSSARVYKKASTSAGRVTTLGKNQHVIVVATKGNWAAIRTLSGKQGFVKTSALRKAS